MTIRALIVDDEPLARDGVELLLCDESDVEIVGTCGDGNDAVRSIRKLQPDLVFLDIKMPGLSGFDVIESIGADKMPAVIFLTAYEEHAVRAFGVNAIDYLLKPIDGEALRKSLIRVRRKLAQDDILRRGEQLRGLLEGLGQAEQPTVETPNRIMVRSAGRVHFVNPDEVTWVEAAGDYVTVHTPEKSHLVRDSMKSMEARLGQHGFCRIHRSSLVNIQCVKELAANDNGDQRVILRDGTALRLGRNYKDALYSALNAEI